MKIGGDDLYNEYEKWKAGVNQHVKNDFKSDTEEKQRCLSSIDWNNYRPMSNDPRRDSIRKNIPFRRGDSVSCTPEKITSSIFKV